LQFIRLRVSGFKSFCDVTELDIGPGLTGIVGPNGCGKSNVVEALRWVMGESSAKGLRGGEMEDVIFGGSALRPPYDLAEVALGLKRPPVAGDDAAIHVLPKSEDLEISRRIGRGTGSLYRLNGREVRARDIQLLFADAGSGAKSPAIVGQGQVGFIVEAKPEERRRLLEEAAGIGGMHSRRREAELKLQATTANLERVTDQLGLLAARRTALEKQAKEAERYKKLQAQIRALEAFLVKARISAGRAALEAAIDALAQARTTLGERQSLAAAAEAAHAAAAARLPGLRDAAAVAAALLARLAERHERQAEADAQQRAAFERLVQDRDETRARLDTLAQAIEAGAARRAVIAEGEAELAARLTALAEESATLGPAAEAAAARHADSRRCGARQPSPRPRSSAGWRPIAPATTSATSGGARSRRNWPGRARWPMTRWSRRRRASTGRPRPRPRLPRFWHEPPAGRATRRRNPCRHCARRAITPPAWSRTGPGSSPPSRPRTSGAGRRSPATPSGGNGTSGPCSNWRPRPNASPPRRRRPTRARPMAARPPSWRWAASGPVQRNWPACSRRPRPRPRRPGRRWRARPRNWHPWRASGSSSRRRRRPWPRSRSRSRRRRSSMRSASQRASRRPWSRLSATI
jgi:energy-coupling factor transporter ATP-binding protein EcfA2